MKTLVISLVLVLAAAITHAQGIIELNETRVDYNPLFSEISQQGDMYIMKVRENRSGEFETDPVAFLNRHFDARQFITLVGDRDYDSYQVSFRSNKGELRADFDKEGDIENVSHRFKNVTLPYPLIQKLFLDNQGWTIVKNIHVAYGKDGKIDKSFYKVTLQNGKQKKKLKIDATQDGRFAVVNR